MRRAGKRACILLEDEIPSNLAFLASGEEDCFVFRAPYPPRLSIAVDLGSRARLEKRVEVYYEAAVQICIDHHEKTEEMAPLFVIDPSAAASCVLVLELLQEAERAWGLSLFDRAIAEALYAGILTDTGCFRYSNADKRALLAAAFLYDYGIDHARICNEIYENNPLPKLQIEAEALKDAELFAGGRGVISVTTLAHLERFCATPAMTDSGIDRLRSIAGVEIACHIKEKEEGVYKVSLRAKNCADVNRVAKALGGGGHLRAAAATAKGPLPALYEKTKGLITDELARCGLL